MELKFTCKHQQIHLSYLLLFGCEETFVAFFLLPIFLTYFCNEFRSVHLKYIFYVNYKVFKIFKKKNVYDLAPLTLKSPIDFHCKNVRNYYLTVICILYCDWLSFLCLFAC